ncbi:MAG: ORF6N domain-containing protein [Candidatus Taylorbacteria bacterium]
MKENKETNLVLPVTTGFIESRIKIIRGQKVIISSDLAELYQVEPKVLIQAVKRNINRFPDDFMFQLTLNEAVNLKSQFVTSSWGGARRALPYAFTELGVAMLSSVLNSECAVQMNIFIMRAFVALRQLLSDHAELAIKIEKLEKEQNEQGKDISAISIAITKLLREKDRLSSAIGFQVTPI